MPRRKPFSAKQKKEQMKDKRAVKRGELDPSEVRVPSHPTRANRPGNSIGQTTTRRADPSNPSNLITTKLMSKFTALSTSYLERTRDLAHTVPLPRPLGIGNAIFPVEWMERDQERLTCPGRPKFRYGQTKKEVERNEEGLFVKWVQGTRAFVEDWVEGREDMKDEGDVEDEGEENKEVEAEPEEEDRDGEKAWGQLRSPTWFETNLEVWRQLWRVTESSQILLLLADARCPPLHLPPSLRTYVQSLKPHKEVILVLTKSDLVDPEALVGWREWVKVWWAKGYKATEGKNCGWDNEGEKGEVQVVAVHSYETDALYAEKPRHRPDLPEASLRELIAALRTAHTRLSTPPIRISSDSEKLKAWKAPVRSQVDWDLLARGPASAYPPANANIDAVHAASTSFQSIDPIEGDQERVERDPEKEPLTIGLIGQPNVGKSSLLNAVLGESRVRASRQPGKTKHFQTLFWGWKRDIKVVDCPGLVCPSLVGLEVQALCGILPISQIPSMHACILTAGHLLPLEDIFAIPAPASDPSEDYADKRTWRTPRAEEEARERAERKVVWTAGGIMEARALDRGYLTAKGGRPDGNRAANGMMRQLADGKIRWCFFPPGCELDREGKGIWLGYFAHDDKDKEEEDSGPDSDEELRLRLERIAREADEVDSEIDSEDDGEASEVEYRAKEIDRGFFAALGNDSGDDETEDEEDEEDENEEVDENGVEERK